MTPLPPDRSRDRRIEDPTNLWIVHPASAALVPWAVARGISANMVSCAGLALGVGAAAAYARWDVPLHAVLGLALSVGWLVADGLDGMVARATGTTSPFGRALDGMVDHGVFTLIYVVLALSIGTAAGWALAIAAGAAHAVQSNLYEGERARFHRRLRGEGAAPAAPASRNPLVRLYDGVAGLMDRVAARYDAALPHVADPARVAAAYADAAAAPLRLMRLLSANTRVAAIFVACLAGDPRLFWWFTLVPLTAVLVIGLVWHRRVEASLLSVPHPAAPSHTATRT